MAPLDLGASGDHQPRHAPRQHSAAAPVVGAHAAGEA